MTPTGSLWLFCIHINVMLNQQQSTFNFPDKQTLKRLFFEAGFNDITVRSFTGGVAAMHLGYKQK